MTRTTEAARGKWKGILLTLGVDRDFLTGKHGPCPMCGGHDRFRWDNRDGGGSFICSQCGAGDGFALLRHLRGWDFAAAAREVDAIVGNVRAEPIKRRPDEKSQRQWLNDLWRSGQPVRPGDRVSSYLHGRGLDLPQNVGCLRYCERTPVPGESGCRPAMVAMIAGPDGKPANLHRTFLGPSGKADMDKPRATMPGEIPDGAAVRLSLHGERLGIAEGIETALAASARFGLPVWAAVNSTMLAKWQPPESVREVVVFGDNDPLYGGQAAALALAHRLAARMRLMVDVKIPAKVGVDWADADAA